MLNRRQREGIFDALLYSRKGAETLSNRQNKIYRGVTQYRSAPSRGFLNKKYFHLKTLLRTKLRVFAPLRFNIHYQFFASITPTAPIKSSTL